MTSRVLRKVVPAVETADGAGVRLKRALGYNPTVRLDPFLMLDAFSSDNPDDYIAGFPAHPHRGFETVTYLVEGRMRHRDHLGNEGDLQQGGVQWMTAGRGIIHEEMPQQEQGLLRGFQLWINLPSAEKMKPASYRDISDADMPSIETSQGARIKAIAGTLTIDGQDMQAPMAGGSTDPLYLDIQLPANASVTVPVSEGHNAMLYVFEGHMLIASDTLDLDHLGILGEGRDVEVMAGPDGVRALLIAGKPINEPVVQYGPFVMNTQAEINQALRDYRDGSLTA